jgi:hypothetical protein
MKARAAIAILALLAAGAAWSQPIAGGKFAFIAWNPGAALSFFPTSFVFRSVLPTVLFNQEAGVALAAGWSAESGLVEARLALGNSNSTYFVAQVQLGASWFLGETLGWMQRGPYLGGSLRYWDLVQVYSGVQTHNLAPMIHMGWWIDIGPAFLDIRLSQVFAVATASNVPNARPGVVFLFSPLPAVSPVMPIGLVQIGFRIP